jgi:DNA-binding Lrp family transcriptional regulator
MKLNERDIQLVRELRTNSRKSIALISRELGIPVSTIFDRISQMEGPVIKRYATLLDFSKMGYLIRVCYMIKSSESAKDELKDFLLMYPRTNTLMRINNGFDFYADMVFRSMSEMEDFQERLKEQGAVAAEGHYILSEIKQEAFLSKEQTSP